jgi:hypothetical protein
MQPDVLIAQDLKIPELLNHIKSNFFQAQVYVFGIKLLR